MWLRLLDASTASSSCSLVAYARDMGLTKLLRVCAIAWLNTVVGNVGSWGRGALDASLSSFLEVLNAR